jgi:glycosyltransferase involved in cell wall biosynthesis
MLIDLTDLEQWGGNHGGTQRVVYGISKNFYLKQKTLEYEVRFISFSAEAKKFYFTSFEPIYNQVEGLESASRPKQESYSSLRMGIRNRIAKRVKNTAKAKQNTPEYQWVTFRKDDIALVLGKPWDNLDIQEYLSQQKRLTDFKLVELVYDLVICLYPHLQNPVLVEPYTRHMKGAVKSSDLMLAISQSTANDLKEFCKREGLKTPKTKVIRLGDDISEQIKAASSSKPDPRIKSKYIVCVGTVEIRKNHSLLYYAYKLAAEKGVEIPQLVIVGGQGWLAGDIQHLINNDPAIKDKINILNGVNDQGLAWIYKNCMFSIYPSMYEGWGLPIAESLAYGKLCISSHTSSMPEIAGNLIDYFSPYSPEECLQKIELYCDDTKRWEKEKKLIKNYRQTSWEQTFNQVLDCLKNLP